MRQPATSGQTEHIKNRMGLQMPNSNWESRGKTVSQLIKELQSFENQEIEVRISIDGGETSVPISLVGKVKGGFAMLKNCEETPSVINHRN